VKITVLYTRYRSIVRNAISKGVIKIDIHLWFAFLTIVLQQEYNGVTLCDRELMYTASPKVEGIRADGTWSPLREEGVSA